jgi:exosortase/archaeosortase family protein
MTIAHTLPCRPVIVTAPAWLALHALALWPHALWAAHRVADGSDDPLGLAALAVLLSWLWLTRESLRATPRLAWLGAAAALTVASTAALFAAPPLAAALLAALAISAHVCAWLPDDNSRSPRAALAGLTLLALPLIASLQFYAGYPLRVFTAQFSAWLLQAVGIAAERSGTAMTVNGQLVIVDAPCSGVQLAWLAYFAACSVALFTRRGDGAFLRRLPLISLLVLAGNVLRNTTLLALEARPQSLAPWAHEAVGIVWLMVVVGLAVRLMAQRGSLK